MAHEAWWLRKLVSLPLLVLVYILLQQGVWVRHDVTRRNEERRLQEALKKEKGSVCHIPKLDPFAPEITKFDKTYKPLSCDGAKDWVKCKFNKCRVVYALAFIEDVNCSYRDILFQTDFKYYFSKPTVVHGYGIYMLRRSDFAEVQCKAKGGKSWIGLVVGLRPIKPKTSPPGRENTYNILILGYDSTSKNGFIRRMPKSYKVLNDELGAITLNGYNIVGDGTIRALIPLLTGRKEYELPDVRRGMKQVARSRGRLNKFPFIWNTLSEDGYRTAYYEDSPSSGTFQYRMRGFKSQPTDHYLRHFFIAYKNNFKKYNYAKSWYCVGDTLSFALMLNLTREYMHIDKRKKFNFNFISDITHDNFNYITNADDKTVEWLRSLKNDGTLDNTVLLVMGDHGARFSAARSTLQGKMEERQPLMSFVLPPSFIENRREAYENLKHNIDVLTTPFDIHSTLLDAVNLSKFKNTKKYKGSDLERSISLFTKIPSNRSCSEAGIDLHHCTCMKWKPLPSSDPMYLPAAMALVDFINEMTEEMRVKCEPRTLISIEWVMIHKAKPQLVQYRRNRSDAWTYITYEDYSVKIIASPGYAMYEASMTYYVKTRKFSITSRDISRVNAYNREPACISATRPDLNMYCYCKKS